MKPTIVGLCFTLLNLAHNFERAYSTGGSFPNPTEIGRYKPIETTADVTCGTGEGASYCEPATDEYGLTGKACNARACNNECPGRDRSKDGHLRYINVMDGNLRNCIIPKYDDTRGTRMPSFDFRDHPSCFAQPTTVLRTGTSPGQFTLTVWIKQAYRNAGVILEKVASPRPRQQRQVVLSFMVGAFSLVLQYRGTDGRSHFKILKAPFPAGRWHHLALQVYNRSVSVFIDGIESDDTPFLTAALDYPIEDVNYSPIVKVGQRMQVTGQFVGRLHDYRWYDQALTNREIQEIYSGTFKTLNIQSNCLCPRGYPRVHPIQERYCIRNGDPDTTQDKRLRLDEDAHPLAYANDGDMSTSWISSIFYMPGGIMMNIDLENGEYQVFTIEIKFYSPQPQAITISRLSNKTTAGLWKEWGYFADDCELRFGLKNNEALAKPDSFNCIQFPEEERIPYSGNNVTFSLLSEEPFRRPGKDNFYNTPDLMNFVMAEKIQFRMQYQYYTAASDVHLGHQRYAIKEVEVVGRCNCHGHADTCDMTNNPYECQCLPRSHTGGVLCDRCLPLYNNKPFRMGTNVEAYDCKPCECHGHADSCHYDETLDPFPNDFFKGGGGRCDSCKHHTKGINCDRCADLYFRLKDALLDDPDLCHSCDCHPSGTVNGSLQCAEIDGQCSCKSKVIGRMCGVCVDGYYALELDNLNGCKPCECNLTGTVERDFRCKQEGGQCGCKQFVQGRTCSECKFGYKNLRNSNIFGCEPCNCNALGARDQFCNSVTGNCFCKPFVQGMHCDECYNGYWRLSSDGCKPCDCDVSGSVPGTFCDKVTGQCVCKANSEGRACDRCKDKYFNLDANNPQGCENCHCDPRGTIGGSLVCDKDTGQCDCKANVISRACNECKGNTFGLDWSHDEGCQPCNCDPSGTLLGDQIGQHELVCHATSGQCACLPSREGRTCDMCSAGYYLPPNEEPGCLDCDCHPYASTSKVCNNATGQCPCKPGDTGLTGRRCDNCMDSYWKFDDLFGQCEECGCNEKGSVNDTCDVISGECTCKGNVLGIKCDECKPGSSHLTKDNPMGCYSHPEQQAPPAEVNKTSTWAELSWNPPDLPNGDSLQYELYRNEEVIHTVNVTSPFQTVHYSDELLLPYTEYEYYIKTSNIGGFTTSTEITVRTLAGIPTGVPPLNISDVTATAATFAWGEPDVAHGPIEKYVLQSLNPVNFEHPKIHYTGLETTVKIDDLLPFMNYTFIVRACTSGGCGDSMPVVIKTPEAKPKGQQPPSITAVSNTSLLIEWLPPEEPNGVILQYELLMRGKPDSMGVHQPLQQVVFVSHGYYNPRPAPDSYAPLDEPETNFTVNGLQPFTEYQFLVLSANSIGSTESTWATGRTLEGSPLFIAKPIGWAISSSEINITWKAPDPISEVRGDVKMYQVVTVRNSTNPYAPPTINDVLYYTGPNNLQFTANELDPYIVYKFFINMCNSVSCVESERIDVMTLPAAPEGQGQPLQWDQTNVSISMEWDFPEKINGPQPKFTLFQSPVAFSTPPPEMSKGIRFPGDSFLRYSPDVIPSDASYSGIRLHFRTFQSDALLFFASSALASDYTRHEYLVIQLRDGRPWFLFDLHNSPTSVTVDNDDQTSQYNDGLWHRLEVNRFERDSYIELDYIYTGSGSSSQSATVFGKNDGVFIGGLPHDYNIARPGDKGMSVVVEQGFVGCLKEIAVQRDGMLGTWSNVTFDEAEEVYRTYDAWQGCPDALDSPAAHFLGKGYLQMKDLIHIQNLNTWSIRMHVRFGFSSGILFYAAGRRHSFIMGTVNNGSLRFIASSKEGELHDFSLHPETLPVLVSLCDGNWHLVEFYNKGRNLGIHLDGSDEIGPDVGQSYDTLDLSSKFYLGGVDDHLMGASSFLFAYFDEDGRSFGGCMKNIYVNSEAVNLFSKTKAAYNVDLDGCPRGAKNSHVLLGNRDSKEISGSGSGFSSGSIESEFSESIDLDNVCVDSSFQGIYEGDGLNHTSVGLTPFTQYLYRVMSSNDGGETRSAWKVMRAGEGTPMTVSSPYNEKHISGWVVELNWLKPLFSNGIIVNYTIAAYKAGNDSEDTDPALVTSFSGGTFVGNLTGLRPYTRYEADLTACTSVGCEKSSGQLSFATIQEAPYGVAKPSASVSKDSMRLFWGEPSDPNGVVVNYTLFHNGSKIYSGSDRQHTVQGLATFEIQEFHVMACTVNGCNSSEVAAFYSAQIPPSHVDPPMLSILGSHSIEVRWLEPAILNGIFERYVLYLSTNESELGDAVYNSTNPKLQHTLENLYAGMNYFVTLETCTGGGCKQSTTVSTYTTESIPEEIPKPIAISRSPFSFDVTWTEPIRPNGVITNYTLFFDEELKVTTTEPSSYHIDMLTPYSRHTFRIHACTLKGCASSLLNVNRTLEAKPEGEVSLTVTVADSQSLQTRWNMPVRQNGEMTYSVMCTGSFFINADEKDFRQVNETRVLHVGSIAEEWTLVEGLVPYTEYLVQVNASNSVGYVLSNMRTISMPPGAPAGVSPPHLRAISPTAIVATWKDPVRNNAPGASMFQLEYRRMSPLESERKAFDGKTRQMSYTLENLKPYEEYEFRLTAFNEFGSTTSSWVSLHTQQTAPEYVEAPEILFSDAWSQHLRWKKPTTPNGVLQNYTVFEGDDVIATMPANITHRQIQGLLPFTWYTYIIQACTLKACTNSTPTKTQTNAAAPEDLDPPEARAESPTSIFLTWKPPHIENGILGNYVLERRPVTSDESDEAYILGSFVPSQSLRYLDDTGDLTPFTPYQYRVTSSTIGGGPTVSNWTTVVTRPGRPGGMHAPEVIVTSSRSAHVRWVAPAESNGPLTRYEVSFPDPRLVVSDVNQTDCNVTGLIPYTEYQVSVIACTDGGCSESPKITITTHTAVPDGLEPPVLSAISESYVSVQWNPPKYPNGPGVFYELMRIKKTQPLVSPEPADIGVPETVYRGTDLSYHDRSLQKYTTVSYVVSVFNNEGSISSNESTVTTLGGVPIVAPSPRVVSFNHTSIEIAWDKPSISDLQGEVHWYFVSVSPTSEEMSFEKKIIKLQPNATEVVLDKLRPGTQYSITLKTDNGAHNITSNVLSAYTDDGAPDGMQPPVAYSLSATELHVSWLMPEQPNGEIMNYSIILDGRKLDAKFEDVGSHVIADLLPFTVYTLQLEACTEYACTISNSVLVTTQENIPKHMDEPVLKVLSARKIEIIWQPPEEPNGILKTYVIQRRTMVPCEEVDGEVISKNKCRYVRCNKKEKACGSKCYTPSLQECCDGDLFDKKAGFRCCDNKYMKGTGNFTDVCCGEKFHPARGDHICCRNRYVQVLPGEVCCEDIDEDRVLVGAGDSCCGIVPFYSDGAQICCNGNLYNGFHSKCCGTKIVDINKVCCGATDGRVYEEVPDHICCGYEYISSESAMCCHDKASGLDKVHQLSSQDLQEKKKCCSNKLIPFNEKCCNNVGYDPMSHICSDVPTFSYGSIEVPQCGTGMVCLVSQARSSFCDRCDFDRKLHECFIMHDSFLNADVGDDDGICVTSFYNIFTGMPQMLNFIDDTVTPFTEYQYKVVASNAAGSVESDLVSAKTIEDIPEGVEKPEWTSNREEEILLSWKPPKQPNGVIKNYALVRNGLEIWNGLLLEHEDDFEVLPFRKYEYKLKACTSAGCGVSSPVFAMSIQGIPEELDPPTVKVLSPEEISIFWTPPLLTNGIIQKYMLNETDIGTIHIIEDSPHEENYTYIHRDLQPHSTHEYSVTACTFAGCTTSDEVAATTYEARPEGVWVNPTAIAVNKTAVEIYWDEPEYPNGIIREYRLLRRALSGRRNLRPNENLIAVYAGGPERLNLTDTQLRPGTSYQYQLVAVNGAGFGLSELYEVEMPIYVPAGIPSLDVRVTGSQTLLAQWSMVDAVDVPYKYSVIVQRQKHSYSQDGKARFRRDLRNGEMSMDIDETSEIPLIYSAGTNQTYIIEKLSPYTVYRIRVRTCMPNDTDGVGCIMGDDTVARTLPAPPQDQAPPSLKAVSPYSVDVSWEPPKKQNGILTQYQVFRREASRKNEEMVFSTGDMERLWFTDSDTDLQAYTEYEYSVRVKNREYSTDSPWASVTTLQDLPSGIGLPSLTPISAFSIRARWDRPAVPNGDITSYSIEYRKRPEPTSHSSIETAVTVPSTSRKAIIGGLKPFTYYDARLVVTNSAEMEARSDWASVKTSPAAPQNLNGLSAVKIEDGRSLLLTWDPPSVPNGEITHYSIYEMGYDEALYQGLFRQFLFRRLKPYTNYTLMLEACTGRNLCTRSPPETYTTAQTAPDVQNPPTVSMANATAITLTWTRPMELNGVLISYKVIRMKIPKPFYHSSINRHRRSTPTMQAQLQYLHEEEISWAVDDHAYLQHHIMRRSVDGDLDENVVFLVEDPTLNTYNYTDVDLEPYSTYQYKIRSSTEAGFVDSDWVMAETHQAAPTGLKAPIILYPSDRSPNALVVKWDLPEKVNGILQTFRVQKNSSTPLSFPATQFQFTDNDLKAYTVYGYSVTACTAGGCTESETSSKRTLEEAPLYVSPPVIVTVNSTALRVSWETPTISNGVITNYRVLIDGTVHYEGLDMSAAVGGLQAYRLYSVVLSACTASGCRSSEKVVGRTSEAPPRIFPAPELHVTSPHSIEVTWEEPLQPNGRMTTYELRRNSELITVTAGDLTRYHDFGLRPGTLYRYTVTAYNAKGSVESDSASEMTDPAAPSGLEAPSLSAISSSSIHATWHAPANPNGVIMNYTLYVRRVENKKDEKVFKLPGNEQEYTVRGLLYYTPYSFWLQCCTRLGCVMSERTQEMTLEGIPSKQNPPDVSLVYPDDVILFVGWSPPMHPNGVIKMYRLVRRRLVETLSTTETVTATTVYNGTSRSFTDSALLPYTKYQYKVYAANAAGETASDWSLPTRTGEAAPSRTPAPAFGTVTERSIQIFAAEPAKPNGVVRTYTVYARRNVSGEVFKQVTTGIGRDQTVTGLAPFQTYQFKVEACTLKNLCTFSAAALATTLPAPPRGQKPPLAFNITSNSVELRWSEPTEANGVISSYEVQMRRSCPTPYQPFEERCLPGPSTISYVGTELNTVVENLTPYSSYEFFVISVNDYGRSKSERTSVVTLKTMPRFISSITVTSNISVVHIVWRNSFLLNGILVQYELFDDGKALYTGFETSYRFKRTAAMVHKFTVEVTTDVGTALSDTVMHDTSRGTSFSAGTVDTDKTLPDVSTAKMAVHETVWFIAVAALMSMMVIFVVLAVVLRRLSAGEEEKSGTMKPPQAFSRNNTGPKRTPEFTNFEHPTHLSLPTSSDRSMLRDNGFADGDQGFENNWEMGFFGHDSGDRMRGEFGQRREKMSFVDTHL